MGFGIDSPQWNLKLHKSVLNHRKTLCLPVITWINRRHLAKSGEFLPPVFEVVEPVTSCSNLLANITGSRPAASLEFHVMMLIAGVLLALLGSALSQG